MEVLIPIVNKQLMSVFFYELDKEIDVDEIRKAISNLKRGKSHGEDGILNEYFINFQQHLLPLLYSLFNCILDTGFFP